MKNAALALVIPKRRSSVNANGILRFNLILIIRHLACDRKRKGGIAYGKSKEYYHKRCVSCDKEGGADMFTNSLLTLLLDVLSDPKVEDYRVELLDGKYPTLVIDVDGHTEQLTLLTDSCLFDYLNNMNDKKAGE